MAGADDHFVAGADDHFVAGADDHFVAGADDHFTERIRALCWAAFELRKATPS